MTLLSLLGVGDEVYVSATTTSSSSANPQLLMFENMWGHPGTFNAYSANTFSFYPINIPVSVSWNRLAMIVSATAAAGSSVSASARIGLYSLNAATLSMANSASGTFSLGGAGSSLMWVDVSATSATQNITPGLWYLGYAWSSHTAANFVSSFSGRGNISIPANSPINANPTLASGYMTVSSAAPPVSVATSDLTLTGNSAVRAQYIIITA